MFTNGTPMKIYLKCTAFITAILLSVVYAFAPIVSPIMNLMGVKSFLGIEFSGNKEKSYVNVLLIGVDKSETLSDVMMIAQLNMVDNSVNILQIPRDTYIDNRRGDKKLNSAISSGGPENTIKEIQTILDIEIDEYVIITTSGFRDVIDAVGGVYYDVPQDMEYKDPMQDLDIDLKKGYQLLDGDKAEQFVRFRAGYANGDLERIDVQRGFIKEAMKQIIEKRSKGSEKENQDLMFEIANMVTTTFNVEDMLKYAPYILNVNMDSVNIMRLEGEARYKNNISYFFADEDKNQRILDEYFTPDTTSVDLSEVKARDSIKGKNSIEMNTAEAGVINAQRTNLNVYVMDYSNTDGKSLQMITAKLEELGYNIVGSVVSKTCYSDKSCVVSKSKGEYSALLASDLGLEKYILNDELESDADIVFVIGKDM